MARFTDLMLMYCCDLFYASGSLCMFSAVADSTIPQSHVEIEQPVYIQKTYRHICDVHFHALGKLDFQKFISF